MKLTKDQKIASKRVVKSHPKASKSLSNKISKIIKRAASDEAFDNW